MISTASKISRNMIAKYNIFIHYTVYKYTFVVTKVRIVTDIAIYLHIDRFVWGRGFAIGDSITKWWFHVQLFLFVHFDF